MTSSSLTLQVSVQYLSKTRYMFWTAAPRRESYGLLWTKRIYLLCEISICFPYMNTTVTTVKIIYWNYWFRGVMSLQRPAACRRGWEMPGLHVWIAVTFIKYHYFSRMLLKLSLQIHWELQIPFKYNNQKQMEMLHWFIWRQHKLKGPLDCPCFGVNMEKPSMSSEQLLWVMRVVGVCPSCLYGSKPGILPGQVTRPSQHTSFTHTVTLRANL